MSQDRRRDRHASRRGTVRKPFVGVDGEGGNLPSGHEYLLLRAGTHVLETGSPLTWQDCLPFLADLPKDSLYCAYFFDYDVTMCLRGLPEERIRRLLDVDCRRIAGRPCSSWPIDFAGYQLDYIPGKEFRVRRKGEKWTIISDVGSFFQCSFVKALQRWFPEQQYVDIIERIRIGKEQRNEFGAVTADEREYNLLEIRMLEELMERFRDVCDSLDIHPNKWQGPGTLVSAVFRREGLPRNRDITLFHEYPAVARAANDAYYGGRFEVSTFGHIDGPIYQYDINSAYATTYRQLPCLLHGTWKEIRSLPAPGTLYLADIRFQHSSEFHWGTLPVRTRNGTLVWPRAGSGVYWSTEVDVARRYGVDIEMDSGYQFEKQCDCRNFQFVEDAYHERKKLGKDGKGMVLKLFLASTYGKLAQSVGCAPYSNPVWAGLIVSAVRALLVDAALSVQLGAHVLMLATDGLFSTAPIPGLRVGTELGEWGEDEQNPGHVPVHDSIFIVQSGVYFLPDKNPKTRGIPQARVTEHEQDFKDSWSDYLQGSDLRPVSVPLTSFVGLRLAMARNKPELAGQWVDNPKSISFDWHSKRAEPQRNGTSVVTVPLQGGPDLRSEPYSRVIGGLTMRQALDLADQPDWGDQL